MTYPPPPQPPPEDPPFPSRPIDKPGQPDYPGGPYISPQPPGMVPKGPQPDYPGGPYIPGPGLVPESPFADEYQMIAADFPWLVGTPLLDVYLEAWIETDDHVAAQRAIRRDPAYDQVFAGNRREDGSFRWSESQYMAQISGFENTLIDAGVNPDLFRDKFADLIAGDKDALTFRQDIALVQEEILNKTSSVRAAYINQYGLEGADDLSDAAIIAMFLDGDVSRAIIENRISTAQVSASAYDQGFGFSEDLASRIVEGGFAEQAGDFFVAGGEQIPFLSRLAQRNADPNDPFNIDDFADALLFGDVTQRGRMRRLIAEENARFSKLGQFARQGSSVTGLQEF